MKKVFCPNCGYHHEPQPVKYDLEEEKESFEGYLDGVEMDGDTVIMDSCHVEAGPYNGDRNLMDYEVLLCSCPICNNTFTTEKLS